MATLGSLIISLEANTAAFNSAMDKSAYLAQQSSKRIQDSLNGISSTIKGLVATALTLATLDRVFESFKNIYEAEKALEKMAIRLGTTSSELSALQYAAKKSGMDIEVFNTSIQRMEKNISTAALPAKNTAGLMGDMGEEAGRGSEAFRNLGINAGALKMLPLKEQLLAISERMRSIPNETDKVRIALDIFGKGGGGMVVMLKAGEQAIDDWIDRGRQLGIVIDDNMVKRGSAAGKSIGELKDALYGLAITLADTVAPPIKMVSDALTEKIIAIRAADPALQNLVQTVKDFAEAWAEPALNALKMGVIGGRIAGLQGAALGAAAGFGGLTTSLRELADILQNPAVLAFLGGAAGSRLGIIGAGAGALAGATTGIALGIRKDAAAYKKSMEEDFGGYESPMGSFSLETKAQLDYEKNIKKYQGLFTEPSFGSPKGAGGRGGGKGGMDASADRMKSIIDTLEKDIAKLSEGSIAEIDAWAKKTIDDIEKVGRKGAETQEALALVTKATALKKQKVEEEFQVFVGKESGNAYLELEAQAKDWLNKYKGIKGAEDSINNITARKRWEIDVKNYQEVLGLYKSYFDSIASLTPNLSEQNILKQRALDLEIEINKYTLEKKLNELEIANIISKSQADELRGLDALSAQAKKYNMAMEQNKGLSGWAWSRSKAVDQKNTIADMMGGLESGFQNAFSSGLQGVLSQDKTTLKKISQTLWTSGIGEINKGSITRLFDTGSKLITSLRPEATGTATATNTASQLGKAAQGLQNASIGFNENAAQFGLAAGGLLLSGVGIMTNSQALVAAGTVLQVAGMAIQLYEALASTNTTVAMTGAAIALTGSAGALDAAATALMIAASVDVIPFFHSGGVITAHRGWPRLASDEVPIIAQTGERVLSRRQNRDYEAGSNGGGNRYSFSPTVIINPKQEMNQADYDRHAKMIIKSWKREMGNRFNG